MFSSERLSGSVRRSTIDKLKSDNEQLKDELALEKRHSKVYDSVSAQAQIAKLQDAGDTYTRKIELEKRRIEVRAAAAVRAQARCVGARPAGGGGMKCSL
jgi:hypothetical protein